MAANTFDLTSLNGKDLYAKKDVLASWLYPYSLTGTKNSNGRIITKPVTFTIKAGDRIGKIFNYVYFKNGAELWFAFLAQGSKTKLYYVKYDEKSFDVKALKAQGVKTVEERAEEKADDEKGLMDKALDSGKKILLPLGIGVAVVYIGSKALTAYIQKK